MTEGHEREVESRNSHHRGIAGDGSGSHRRRDRPGQVPPRRSSSAEPASATGLKFRVLYKNPDDPAAKPPPVEAATFRLPRGMRIDTEAVPRCDATDEEIRALGHDACPANTQIGSGRLLARTGVPGSDEVRTDVVAYNGDEEIIEVVFFEGTNAVAGIDRLTIDRNVLTAHPPTTPGGPPDGRTAVQRIFLEVPLRLGAGGDRLRHHPAPLPQRQVEGVGRLRVRRRRQDDGAQPDQVRELTRSGGAGSRKSGPMRPAGREARDDAEPAPPGPSVSGRGRRRGVVRGRRSRSAARRARRPSRAGSRSGLHPPPPCRSPWPESAAAASFSSLEAVFERSVSRASISARLLNCPCAHAGEGRTRRGQALGERRL